MAVLLEIDPNADKDSSISIAREGSSGEPPTEMRSIGSEKVLNMATLKKHYDALGSYLHVPTVKQARTGKQIDYGKIKSRCEVIVAFVQAVLSSKVFNVTLGNFAKIDCVECGKPIRKRIPFEQPDVQVKCYQENCPASYTLVDKKNDQVEFKPNQQEVECANSNCEHKYIVWHQEMEVGRFWTCPNCKGRNTFALKISYMAEDSREKV